MAGNQSVSTCKIARYNATPNPDTESWVPTDCASALGYIHSVHIRKGAVQFARIRAADVPKVAFVSWL